MCHLGHGNNALDLLKLSLLDYLIAMSTVDLISFVIMHLESLGMQLLFDWPVMGIHFSPQYVFFSLIGLTQLSC